MEYNTVQRVKKLDLYYTKKKIARNCYKHVIKKLKGIINNDTLWIEPSAGNGSFYCIIKGSKIGFDIYPKKEGIKKKDFLKDKIIINNDKKNTVVLGNPPFGKRAKKAIEFFNIASIYSDTIAFILPNQFKKYSAQSKLNKDFKLIDELQLDDDSFEVNNKDYKVRCVFQIWSKLKVFKKDLRIREKPPIKHKDFEIYQYNNTPKALKYFDKSIYGWDFAVPRQGFYDYSKRIKDPKELNKKIQWAFFKAKNKDTLNNLENINFEKIAKNNTSILGFGKHDVIKEYERVYG